MNRNKLLLTALLAALIACPAWAAAGTLDPPAAPDNPLSAMHTIDGIYNMLDTGQEETKRTTPFSGPGADPAPSGRSLDEVYGKAERLAYHVAHYVTVNTTADPVENGTRLLAAYAEARTMSPAEDKRIGVLIGPGQYDLGTDELLLDTKYIDLIGLSNNRNDQHILGKTGGFGTGVIHQTEANLRISNLLVECTRPSGGFSLRNDAPAAYYPDAGAGNESPASTVIINCEFRGNANSWSMRLYSAYKGHYEDCLGTRFSFGPWGEASGTFIRCTAGDDSFGHQGAASGTFIDCNAGDDSFGSFGATTGTFEGCTAGDDSFNRGSAAATFIGCTAGKKSFGLEGTYTNCIAGYQSFGGDTGNSSGTFTNCTAGDYSFGGSATGTFTNCTAGDNSFGNEDATGTFTDCTAGDFSFGARFMATGQFIRCRGGRNSFGGWAISSAGQFTCCDGGENAFGANYAGGTFDSCRVQGQPFAGNNVAPASECTGL